MNVSFGNLIRATGEINEAIFPVRQLARDYETDSGGAGEFRGNCGSLYRKQVLVPATIYTYVVGKRVSDARASRAAGRARRTS